MLLAIYALSYWIRFLDGPFDWFLKVRLALIRNQYAGPFFYRLFECPWCFSAHCGYLIYLLMMDHFSVRYFVLWTLVGSLVGYIGDRVVALLEKHTQEN